MNRQPSPANGMWGGLLTRVRSGFAHAFAVPSHDEEPDAGDIELLNRIARLLANRGLSTPAIFLVESLAPLGFIGSQLAYALVPIIGVVASQDEIERLARLLERRETPALFADLLRCAEEKGRR